LKTALVAAVAGSVLLLPLAASNAATPGSGTVSATSPSSWSGAFMTPTASSNCGGASNPACDNFRLTIQPPAGSFRVDIKLQPTGDWDLQVYAPNGALAGSSGNGPNQLETVTLANPAAGTYTVSAAPFSPAPTAPS
jgi:hypothetical protein